MAHARHMMSISCLNRHVAACRWAWQTPTSNPAVGYISCRTIFGWSGRKDKKTPTINSPEEHPVYKEFLKKKPPPPPVVVRGDLSESSIFAEEEKAPEPGKAADGGRSRRDPASMAAVLDPQPEARRRWERKMLIREVRRRGRLSRTQKLKRTERECLSKSHFIKTSVKKLGPLARQISGKSVEDAIVQMQFSKKKAAKSVREHLEHARNEAIVRRGMGLGEVDGKKEEPVQIETKDGRRRTVTDQTGMYIDQAWVGRGPYGREPEFRARGRVNILRPPVTSISVVLKEEATRIRQHREREEKRRNRKMWTALPNRPIKAQHQYYTW
ncbi:MAG: 54S ribosomal protein L22, mitochondrial [Lichina confinis]|nr:MAG: 54S ribosomal protein L22, mitochondrial [Lichina confinis]